MKNKNITRTYNQHGQLTRYTIDHALFTTEMSRRGRRMYIKHNIKQALAAALWLAPGIALLAYIIIRAVTTNFAL
jgi:hypothetical protein